MVKLSIIVPVYNVAPYLRKCVDSLLAQDYENYEIILVDDGSTDGSAEICEQIVESQKSIVESKISNIQCQISNTRPSVRVIHQQNAGLSAARNTGIKAARGEYICFVDSDDYWEPNVLGGLMEQAGRDNLDVLRFRLQYVKIVDSRKSKVKSEYEVFNPYKSDSFKGNDYSEEPTNGVTFLNTRMNTQCYAWTFMIKRDLIVNSQESIEKRGKSNLLFAEGIYFEDTDWTPRMLTKAKRVASTNAVVYNYLMREGSITNAVSRTKQQKVLDDKIRLIGELQRQSMALAAQGLYNTWYQQMIADTVISVIGILSHDFYEERKIYLKRLRELHVYPIRSRILKACLINFSPRLTVELLHVKNG